jgi:hypothetical protein
MITSESDDEQLEAIIEKANAVSSNLVTAYVAIMLDLDVTESDRRNFKWMIDDARSLVQIVTSLTNLRNNK